MIKLFFTLALLFSSVVASASSSWTFIVTNSNGSSFFIDDKSIQKSGDSVTFWVRTNFKERAKDGDFSSKIQNTINCRTREMINRHFMFYDDINNMGTMTSNFSAKDVDAKWAPIAPDTGASLFLRHVCK